MPGPRSPSSLQPPDPDNEGPLPPRPRPRLRPPLRPQPELPAAGDRWSLTLHIAWTF